MITKMEKMMGFLQDGLAIAGLSKGLLSWYPDGEWERDGDVTEMIPAIQIGGVGCLYLFKQRRTVGINNREVEEEVWVIDKAKGYDDGLGGHEVDFSAHSSHLHHIGALVEVLKILIEEKVVGMSECFDEAAESDLRNTVRLV